MRLINKLKDFFYIGEIGEQESTAAVTLDRLIEYTASLVFRNDLIKSHLTRIEAAKVLPPAEMAKEYIKVYSELEKFILEHEPLVVKRKFTQEELRKDIRGKLGILEGGLDLLLAGDIEQAVKICKIMSESILNQTIAMLGQVTSQRFMDKAGVVEFRTAEFRDLEQVSSSFQKLLSNFYAAISDTIGKEKTKSLFEVEYKKLQEVYGFIPYTIEILKALPLGILEEEKIKIISRFELEEKVKERTEGLVSVNQQLQASEQQLKALNQQLMAKEQALDVRVVNLERSKKAYLNIMDDLDIKTRNLEATLNELKMTQERLIQVEKMATLGQVVAGASHEFNNPLATVIGFSEAIIHDLEDKKFNADRIKNDIERILKNANRCRILVNSLLTYVREPVESEYISLNVNELINESIYLIGNEIDLKDIEISKEYSDDIPEISANREQLSRMFVNFIRNACQSMNDKGTLKVITEKKDDYVNIVFKDTGKGIKEEYINKIFDPFFTMQDTGKGVGLGLYICNNIIKAHKGEISVESEGEGKRATFTVRLPVKR